MKTILFQGDSITDADRELTEDYHLGVGYATMTAATLGVEEPAKYRFYNRGVCGNRVIDLLARIKCDTINLQPDYMSILVGVNDAGRDVKENDGVSAELYEVYYGMFIEQVKEALPNMKLMILEPFLLRGHETSKTEELWTNFRGEVEKRAAVAKRVAEKYDITFVPLMEMFDEMDRVETGLWTKDGVHPTAAGHELIKREWLKAFQTIRK